MSAQMSTKSITFTRAQSGWIFKEDKHVSIAERVRYQVFQPTVRITACVCVINDKNHLKILLKKKSISIN